MQLDRQEMCSKAFGGKELSTTMNADECVARGHGKFGEYVVANQLLGDSAGCALQAAILSPLYKVQDFKVEDYQRSEIPACL